MAGDTVKVLWIGNSYTYFNDVPEMVRNLAESQGITIQNTTVLKGGEKLSGHLQNPVLISELEKGGWDYMIMQEFSSGPAYSTKYVMENIFPYAEAIDSIAHAFSPDVQTVFYMTWGHKNGNIRQTPYPLDDDYISMQRRIITTYIDLSYELGAWCAPVGLAWMKVREAFPEIELYTEDNFHPSLAGSWLAANTIFTTLYRQPYFESAPDGLAPGDGAILQRIAEETVLSNLNLIN